MKVALEKYEPMGSQILLKLERKSESEKGIKFPKDKIDQWMKVVKKGSVVPELAIGDFVLLADPQQSIKLNFNDKEYIQTTVHNVIGRVPVEDKQLTLEPA